VLLEFLHTHNLEFATKSGQHTAFKQNESEGWRLKAGEPSRPEGRATKNAPPGKPGGAFIFSAM